MCRADHRCTLEEEVSCVFSPESRFFVVLFRLIGDLFVCREQAPAWRIDRRQPRQKLLVVLRRLEVVEDDQARPRLQMPGQHGGMVARWGLAGAVAEEGGGDAEQHFVEGWLGGAVDPDAAAGEAVDGLAGADIGEGRLAHAAYAV